MALNRGGETAQRKSLDSLENLLDAGKRALTGESIFMTHFTNEDSGKKRVAFGAPYPGKIIALDMGQVRAEFLCQGDVFLCAALGTEISIAFTKRLGAGFFGSEGSVLGGLGDLVDGN